MKPKKNQPKAESTAPVSEEISERMRKGGDVIPLDIADLTDSPFNPRRSYPEKEMAELADSIRVHGVLQPILARPRLDGGFEVVYGHRRKKAAEKCGFKFIPAIVREMDDSAAREAQIVENTKRQDVAPMDEARGFKDYMDLKNCSVAEVAVRFAYSTATVARRLQLLHLVPKAIERLEEGKLPLLVALELCRLPEKEQAETFKSIAWDLERESAESIVESIRENRHEDLAKAPFDINQSLAGIPACNGCASFSGTNPDLFGDLGGKICTDSSCYRKKVKARSELDVKEAEEKGFKVVKGSSVQGIVHGWGIASSNYAKLKDKCDEDPKHRTWAQLLGKGADGLKKVLAMDGDKSVECYAVADLKEAVKKAGHTFMEARIKQDAKQKAEEKIADKVEEGVKEKVYAELIGAALSAGNEECREILRTFLGDDCARYNTLPAIRVFKDCDENNFDAKIRKATFPELMACLVIVMADNDGDYEESLCKTFDIDKKSIEKVVRKEIEEEAKALVPKEMRPKESLKDKGLDAKSLAKKISAVKAEAKAKKAASK